LTDDKKLQESRFGLAEYKRNIWMATVPNGVAPEDLLTPVFWSHVAPQLRPMDEIICADDDEQWRIELVVIDSWGNGATVVETRRVDLAAHRAPDGETGEALLVRYKGKHLGYAIVRPDGVVLRTGFRDKEAALTHIAANRQTV
jgi:hypothetical protein